jgi:hypothetical protein
MQTTSPPRTFPTTLSVVPPPMLRGSRLTGRDWTVVKSPESCSRMPSWRARPSSGTDLLEYSSSPTLLEDPCPSWTLVSRLRRTELPSSSEEEIPPPWLLSRTPRTSSLTFLPEAEPVWSFWRERTCPVLLDCLRSLLERCTASRRIVWSH